MKIHFIGIGGIGMSGLAGILQAEGQEISGSDSTASFLTDQLVKDGMEIHIGHDPANIPPKTDFVCYSLAIPPLNSEFLFAKRKRIPIASYPEMVGRLTRKYYTIAICGTHGKSTITSMISKILIEHKFDPTVLVGTKLKELGNRNFRVGKSKILILEACEYRRAFLNYFPRVILCHTLDPDHLDYYKDFNDYLSAFEEFVAKLPLDGYFFGNLDDEDVHKIYQSLQTKKFPSHNIFTYSTKYPSSDYFLQGSKIIQRNARVGEMHLKVPGAHNRSNALAAFAVSALHGIAPNGMIQSLNHYEGASRRFEEKGKIGHTLLIDDYAHHPAEITATLDAARERFPNEKICVVFQPHQYNRTKKLFKEFATSFNNADMVIIPNIYEVRDREEDKKGVSAEHLVKAIRKYHKQVLFGKGIENTAQFLKSHAKKFNVIMTMGAGDVWKIAEELANPSLSRISQKNKH